MENFRRNTLLTLYSNIALLLLFLLFSVLLNRSLGPHLKGIYTFYMTIPLLLNAFLSFGLESANVYFIGKKGIKPHKLISNSIFVYSVVFLIVLLLYLFLYHSNLLSGFKQYGSNRILLLLSLLSTPIIMENTFLSTIVLALQKYNLYNILKFIPILFLTIMVAICIFFLKYVNIIIFFSLWIASLIISISFYLFVLREHLHMEKFDVKFFIKTIRYSFKNYIANLSSFLIYRSDYFIISLFLPPKFLGFYSVATVVSEKLWLIPSSIGTVLYPKVSNQKEYNKDTTLFSLKINFLLMIILGLLLGAISNPLIKFLYGKAFLPTSKIILFLLPGIVFLAIPKLLTADLNGQGHPEFSAIYSFIGFIINLVLNIILIPKYGILGAAISTSISYIYISIMILISYKKLVHCRWNDFMINKNDITKLPNVIKIRKRYDK